MYMYIKTQSTATHPHQAKQSRGTVMPKPMGSELSVTLIGKLLLLNSLLLWQLGTGATFNKGTNAAADNGDTTTVGTLSDKEETDLRDLVNSLYSNETTPSTFNLECSDEKDAEIKCSCDSNKACFITEINFVGKFLDGHIPSSIGKFENLRILNLSNNLLTGEIPSSLGELHRLEILKLSSNILSGSIPDSLKQLQSLKTLDLTSNTLTGPIPGSLATLQSLKVLALSYNDLEGTIPQNLKGLQSLQYLDLQSNKLTGRIPDSISYCKGLDFLVLRLNNLSGTIPKSLGTLSSLRKLDLYSNSLSGPIPVELGKLKNLLSLNMDDNNLEGNLPKELGYLVNLREFYLSSNKFNGSIPTTYANLTRLEIFVVGGNNLTGKIPDYFGTWVNLTKLILIGNNFEGNLPAATFNLPKLLRLLVSDVSNPGISFPERKVIPESLFEVVLRNCDISGPIPEYIGEWPRLRYLDLSFNNLTGGVPESFQYLSDKLFLMNNSLTKLPSWITSKKKLSSYPKTDLSYNNFDVDCKNLTCLGIENVNIHPTRSFIDRMRTETCPQKHNSLFINCGGEVVIMGKKRRYQNDTSTKTFNLSPSKDWAYSFSGDYLWAKINDSTLVRNSTCEVSSPEAELDNNFRLAPVSLKYYGLCLRNDEYHVTLHFAETLYSKGEDNSRVGKRVFDVYIQKERVAQDLNIKELLGGKNEEVKRTFTAKIRDGSLEIHFFWAGKGSLYNPPAINGPLISAISVIRIRKLSPWEIAVITVSCILFVLLLFFFMWRVGLIGDRELRVKKLKIEGKYYTLKEIIDATKNFSPMAELGRGRSGAVYKAVLRDRTVAVKKLDPESKATEKIATEVYAVRALATKHENIVKLFDCYSKKHLHLLIYEYMEHGSLGEVLFGTKSKADPPKRFAIYQDIAKGLKNLLKRNPQTIQKNIDSNPEVQLDWQQRFNICKGIAHGLRYLHERERQIIHRNMKASNILLDASWNPKISDFQLANIYEEGSVHITIEAGEDLSYMPIEYAIRKVMTTKVDVYSFGILLLEIVSGKTIAGSSGNEDSEFLLDTAGKLHQKQKLDELVYTRLDPSTIEGRQARIVLDLAIMCTRQSPSLRPKMSQAVAVLESEKTLEVISQEINASA